MSSDALARNLKGTFSASVVNYYIKSVYSIQKTFTIFSTFFTEDMGYVLQHILYMSSDHTYSSSLFELYKNYIKK